MAFVLYGVSILFGLIFPKNKWITVFILFTMFILAAFKTTDADMENYLHGYYAASDEGRYVGFTLFVQLISQFQFDFEEYLCIFYFITFSILFIGIRKLTENVNFILASYLISCYALDVVQMKSALADSIVLLAFAYYFGDNDGLDKKRAGISVCVLFLAMFIHFSTAFYFLAFILYLFLRGKQYYQVYLLLIAIIIAILSLGNGFSSMLVIGSGLGMLGNDNEYLTGWMEQRTRLGFLIPFLEVFLIVAPYWLIKNKNIIKERENNFLAIKLFMCTLILALPLLYFNINYTRLFRIYLILSAVMMSDYGLRSKYKLREFNTLVLFFVSLFYAFFIDTYQSWDTTLGALLNANSILSL